MKPLEKKVNNIWLQKKMQQHNFSRQELARLVCLTPSYIGRLLSGKPIPKQSKHLLYHFFLYFERNGDEADILNIVNSSWLTQKAEQNRLSLNELSYEIGLVADYVRQFMSGEIVIPPKTKYLLYYFFAGLENQAEHNAAKIAEKLKQTGRPIYIVARPEYPVDIETLCRYAAPCTVELKTNTDSPNIHIYIEPKAQDG